MTMEPVQCRPPETARAHLAMPPIAATAIAVEAKQFGEATMTNLPPPPEERDDSSDNDGSESSAGGAGFIQPSGEFSISNASNPGQVNVKQEAAAEERAKLAKRETRAVLLLRVIVIITFLLLAATVCLTVYFYVKLDEEKKFEDEFRFYAARVVEEFNSAMEAELNAADSLSVAVTSHAIDKGMTFPFVTVPHFEYKGANARISGDTPMAFYAPLVTGDTRLAWEAYTRNNSGHILEAYLSENKEKKSQDDKFGLEGDYDLNSTEYGTDGQIWFPGDDTLSPYFPVWQFSPVIPEESSLINVDISKFGYLENALAIVRTTGEAAIDIIADLNAVDGTSGSTFNAILHFGQFRHSSKEYQGDPLSPMAFPVFDAFDEDRKVVGAIITSLYWRLQFRNILPDHISGVICVLENSLGQEATFELDGPEVYYVGEGDLHDTSFDSLGLEKNLQSFMRAHASPETQSLTVVDLSLNLYNYTLRVYPSGEFKDIYVSGEAGNEAAGIAGVFVILLSIFAAFDLCVQRRQRIVMDRAVKATAVVSSIFPQKVREQVINDGHHEEQIASRKDAFLNKDNAEDKALPPTLAEKYPNATVCFADLAGFPTWASEREPDQVFTLLETVFTSFDAIAMSRSVFKVETIGDSYMAATGLPEPQEDHAIRMAKFAADCQHKIEQITRELTESLGPGTSELSLRIGMHSGEVTGGVVRGDKARFQLFGDTVNTASRMESTGIPRQIQCSQNTADALIVAGKSKWLTPREEKIFAKGKGDMQTYFIQVRDRTSKSVSTVSTTSRPVSFTSVNLEDAKR